jgi:hypothetical protein
MKSGSNADTLGINGEISDAISKCASLKAALESATDVKTGNLDLGVFNKSLEKSKTDISDYAKALSALGPEGE